MQDKGMDFKHKEVINITDARRLGYVQDVCADLETGRITAIIVPGGSNKIANFFSSVNDIVIKWEDIKCIGDDLILVEIQNNEKNIINEIKCENNKNYVKRKKIQKTLDFAQKI